MGLRGKTASHGMTMEDPRGTAVEREPPSKTAARGADLTRSSVVALVSLGAAVTETGRANAPPQAMRARVLRRHPAVEKASCLRGALNRTAITACLSPSPSPETENTTLTFR